MRRTPCRHRPTNPTSRCFLVVAIISKKHCRAEGTSSEAPSARAVYRRARTPCRRTRPHPSKSYTEQSLIEINHTTVMHRTKGYQCHYWKTDNQHPRNPTISTVRIPSSISTTATSTTGTVGTPTSTNTNTEIPTMVHHAEGYQHSY